MLMSDINGEFTGVGMEITNVGGFLTVVSPLPGTPSFKAGIKPKDIVIKIDGKNSISMSSSKAVNLIRGKKGTPVILTVLRKGLSEPKDIKIIRDTIEVPIVKTYKKDNVFIIKIYSFSKNLPEKFLEALKEFTANKNRDTLIIDVRGNPGGHLDSAVMLAEMFIAKDKLILTEDYGGKAKNTIIKSGDFLGNKELIGILNNKFKLAVLMDGGSASASEILAGTLSDNNQAILLGEKSFGKGTVQQYKEFKNGTALKYTIAK